MTNNINIIIMKRILITWAAVLCCWVTLCAQQLTEQQAMERALQYMNSGKASAKARRMAAPVNGGSMKLEAAPVEAEKIYAYNMEGGGYVIASGDQRTLPVLGYSTTGSIDWEQMPDNMRSWLKQYDEAIATLGSCKDFCDGEQTTTLYGQGTTKARQSRRAERMAVEPLIKTHWDQEDPYWNQVPTYQGVIPALQGKQCLVGCVATAMAQLMNYWQWPNTVPNGVPDYDYNDQYNGITKTWHIGALPPTWFDWDNMADDYGYYDLEIGKYIRLETTEAQDKAVATLMRYCGQSLKMMYGPAELGGSAAATANIPNALIDYFDYNTPQFIKHVNVPDIEEWEEIIYSELAAGRPMAYCGQSDSGGHSFVCDGYDGNGLFHINWGWSGADDGYFALAVLNPYNNTSSGSGSSGIGYCISEGAVIYTDPHMEPQPVLRHDFGSFYQYAPIYLYNNNFAEFSYSFYESYNVVADNALGAIDSDGNLHPLFMVDPNDSIVYSYEVYDRNYFTVEIDSTMFAAGQYVTLYPMVKFRQPDEEWQVIPPVEQNLIVGRDNEGHFFMQSNQKAYDMQLTDVGITKGTGRLNERSDLTICVRNNDASDYISKLYLVPYYLGHIAPEKVGEVPALAKGGVMECGAYIPAGGEADVTFSFVPEYGGIVVVAAYTDNRYIGELALELNNDKLADYDDYLENKSYLSHDGDKWYWNVELADRIGVKMSHWVPSDNLGLRVLYYFNNKKVRTVSEDVKLKKYLTALPDSIGTGKYTYTYRMPVNVSKPGEYYLDSYIAEVVDYELISYCCDKVYRFTVDDLTGIKEVKSEEVEREKWDGAMFDLQGRPLSGKPTHRGLYIQGNKKIFIR